MYGTGFFPLSAEIQEGREGNEAGSTEELELALEALDITYDPLALEAADETESEELAKKLLDEQGGCILAKIHKCAGAATNIQ